MGETEEDAAAPTGTETSASDADTKSRSLILASVRTALGSDSWLLKSYGVFGTLSAALVTLVVLLAIPSWIANTIGASPAIAFSRAFLLVGGSALVAALVAPMIYARRRRREDRATRRSDFAMAATGYALIVSLYLSLLISAPPGQRSAPPAAIAPVIEFFYGLDPIYAVAPPVVAVVLILVAGNR